MDTQQLISYLRSQLFIVNTQEEVELKEDPAYIALTDKELTSILEVALAKYDSSAILSDVIYDNELLYPVILLARREVYVYLSTKSAPNNDISVGNSSGSTSLKKSQRFEHYYKLIQLVDKEYNDFLTTGSVLSGSASNYQAGNILIDSRYFTPRNYNLSKRPKIRLRVDKTTSDEVYLNWNKTTVNKFAKYELYQSSKPIYDLYDFDNPISKEATLIKTIYNIHNKFTKITGLTPSTKYYFLVAIYECNNLVGYSEVEALTEDKV